MPKYQSVRCKDEQKTKPGKGEDKPEAQTRLGDLTVGANLVTWFESVFIM